MAENYTINNNWTFLPMEKVFKITEDTQCLNLQGIVPDYARKLKLFLSANSGYNVNQDNFVRWTIGTTVDKIKFDIHPYHQDAWTTNSSNEKLNIQGAKEIMISRDGNFPKGNFGFEIIVLGYK